MNIYFLVEGKRTEVKVYPKWLSILIPELIKVSSFDEVVKNNYFVFNGNGFPSLLKHLSNSITDVNNSNKYDYFVICLDSDELSIEECKEEIFSFMEEEKIVLNKGINFEIIIQNKCLETWFLGNPKIFKNNPSNEFLRTCIAHYNVKDNDPESIPKPNDFESTTSIYHFIYLRSLLAERNVAYTKEFPREVVEKYFLDELINRNGETEHIQSFKYFIDFCYKIRKLIQECKIKQ